MKIAYLILTHRFPELLCRLLNTLYTSDVRFIVHIDGQANKSDFEAALQHCSVPKEKIILVENRVACIWGDFSLIEATLNCLHTLLKKDIEYDYAILLSGQDYPLKTNEYIADFLKYSNKNLYMDIFDERTCTKGWQKKVFQYRLKYYHFRIDGSWYNIRENDSSIYLTDNSVASENEETIEPENIDKTIRDEMRRCVFPREMPAYPYDSDNRKIYLKQLLNLDEEEDIVDFKQIVPFGGSQWWALTKDAIEFILRFLTDCPEYLEFHKKTFIPDEIFFQTIIMNNPDLACNVINEKLKFIDWSDPTTKPMVLNDKYLTDIDDIVRNKPYCLFGRKFDPENSENLLNKIDMLLHTEHYNELLTKISPQIFYYNKIGDSFKVEKKHPSSVIFNPLRFDIFIKYLYVKAKTKGIMTDWFNDLYIEHERYFNNFHEDNFPTIKTGQDFLEKFNKLIASFEANKECTTIPISATGVPLDGAHRLAIAYDRNVDMTFATLDKKNPLSCYEFNYEFFVKKGMPAIYTDFVAKEYASACHNSYLMILFPSCMEKWMELETIIKHKTGVFYSKDITLTPIGKRNLIINLYRKEDWISNQDSITWKTNNCFPAEKESCAKVFLLNADKLETVKELKQEIRDLCYVENHSAHSTDFHWNTVELASLFFNQNSIDFINSAEPTHFENFTKQFAEYVACFAKHDLNKEDFCIDGSGVLATCNLRDCYDLDFLFSGNEKKLPKLPTKVDCHNEYFRGCEFDKLLMLNIDDIIYNPQNHFYYQGLKVMHPRIIRDIKAHRNEPKDVKDVALLNAHLARIEQIHEELPPVNTCDENWYPETDALLEKAFEAQKLPKIYLNASFSISTKVEELIERWKDFIHPEKFDFKPADYFWTFEFFQNLDKSLETILSDFFADVWQLRDNKQRDLYDENCKSDLYLFCRICFSNYLQGYTVKDAGRTSFIKQKIKNFINTFTI